MADTIEQEVVKSTSDSTPEGKTTLNEGSASSSEQQPSSPASGEKSLGDVAKEVLAKSRSQEEGEAETEVTEESERLESAATEAKEKESEGKEEPADSEEQEASKGPVPYERFAEVNAKYKEAEPLIQAQQSIIAYCEEKKISKEAFQEALQLAALVRENPQEARKRLLAVCDNLAEYDESVLPKDLQDRITEGEISEAAAKEIASLRAKTKVGATAQRLTHEQMQAQEAQATAQAVSGWITSKEASDPGFRPSKNGDIGIRELTERNLAYLVTTQPPKNTQDLIRHLESAYASAKKILSPKGQATRPGLSTSRSSTTTAKEPKTLAEVAQRTLAKHGISWTPRKE